MLLQKRANFTKKAIAAANGLGFPKDTDPKKKVQLSASVLTVVPDAPRCLAYSNSCRFYFNNIPTNFSCQLNYHFGSGKEG